MQMPTEMGGGAGKVAFIDTEGTFRPERIRPIAQRFNLDIDAVLENVRGLELSLLSDAWCSSARRSLCWTARPIRSTMCMQIVHARAYTHEQQMGERACQAITVSMHDMPAVGMHLDDLRRPQLMCVRQIAIANAMHAELLTPLVAKMVEEPFKLLIMDSITANLRVDFSGRGELAERCTLAVVIALIQHHRTTSCTCTDERQGWCAATCRQQKLGQLMNRLKKVCHG
jgi:RecA/RadA recombinase